MEILGSMGETESPEVEALAISTGGESMICGFKSRLSRRLSALSSSLPSSKRSLLLSLVSRLSPSPLAFLLGSLALPLALLLIWFCRKRARGGRLILFGWAGAAGEGGTLNTPSANGVGEFALGLPLAVRVLFLLVRSATFATFLASEAKVEDFELELAG